MMNYKTPNQPLTVKSAVTEDRAATLCKKPYYNILYDFKLQGNKKKFILKKNDKKYLKYVQT